MVFGAAGMAVLSVPAHMRVWAGETGQRAGMGGTGLSHALRLWLRRGFGQALLPPR